MSGLCGWVGTLSDGESAERIVQAMAAPLARFDGTPLRLESGPRHGLAVAAAAGRAHLATHRGCSAAIWGRPTFTDEKLDQLARTLGPAAALIELFLEAGPQCCARLAGSFAFALVNRERGEALLAIDRMGVHGLIYRLCNSTVVFASTANALRQFPGARGVIDWQSILNYVHFHIVPGPATAIRGETRLLPGQYLHFHDERVDVGHYWRPHFIEDEQRPFVELREQFLGTLTSSVRRMSTDALTGAFLSGGTDSSTVSGLLGQVTGKPAETFSIGFDQQGYDEMEYARIAARHFKTAHHEYYVTPADIVDAIPKLAAIHDQPFGNASAVPTYCCARLARDAGIEVLLGGDGGDELFGGNARYATQYLYSLYERIPQPLRNGLLESVARNLAGAARVPPIRWYRRLVEIASTPLPERMEVHNLLLRFGPSQVFTEDLLSKVDVGGPHALMREVYAQAGEVSLINRMLAYDFRFTLADSDLPKVVKSCELAGIPVDFPMLDDRLVDFSVRLPPHLKLKGTKLRYFFKEALRDFLPDKIIAKTKHGFGLPFGPWMQIYPPLADFVMSNLASLRNRGFIRTEFIDKLTRIHLAEHPGYYGTMAWVLMMLEQWLQQHQPETA